MTLRTALVRLMLLSSFAVAGHALASEEAKIPSHTLNSIRLTVKAGEALAVATALETPVDAPNATVRFKVEQALMGQLPAELVMPMKGFSPGDVHEGAKYLISMRFSKRDQRWVSTGNYDLISDGLIRDIPVDTYLARAAQEAKRHAARPAVHSTKDASKTVPASATQPAAESQATGFVNM